MEPETGPESVSKARASKPSKRARGLALVLGSVGVGVAAIATASAIAPSSPHATLAAQIIGISLILAGSVAIAVAIVNLPVLLGFSNTSDEAAARIRLVQAEQQLAELLQQSTSTTTKVPTSTDEQTGQATKDRLTLPALWEVTHSRLDLYHQIATGQARRSFLTAQAAMVLGFVLLMIFAYEATKAHTTTGAITTATLGTVSAALAGYISRTFVRSQQSAADHLRAYFDQPLEFAKYLAAERLLASNTNLDDKNRTAILMTLVQTIVTPGPLPPSGTPTALAPPRRQTVHQQPDVPSPRVDT